MNSLISLPVVLCTLCVAVGILSLIIPQKRTRHILSFIIGMLIIVVFINSVMNAVDDIHISLNVSESTESTDYENEYLSAVAKQTAKNLVAVTDELLQNEGIEADDIRLSVKISDDYRIYVDRVDIYINEDYEGRKNDVEDIVYRNLSKEPDVYVNREEFKEADGQ